MYCVPHQNFTNNYNRFQINQPNKKLIITSTTFKTTFTGQRVLARWHIQADIENNDHLDW